MAGPVDTLIIGTGGIGSAVAWHLAQRGQRVLGLDRFAPGHNRGSSHGQTRVIRKAYFEHADYVPLLERSYSLWRELQARCGETLFETTGVLGFGPADGVLVPGIQAAAERYNLAIEVLDGSDTGVRFPGFRPAPDTLAVFEPDAGYLFVERAVRAHAGLAEAAGATLRSGVTVLGWQDLGSHVRVDTTDGCFEAGRLVVTAGAWASELLADLDIPFRVLRKHLHWVHNQDPRYRQDQGCPVFFFERPEGVFYGFPAFDHLGVKISEHTGGETIDHPLALDQTPDPVDVGRIDACLAAHLPGVSQRRSHHEVCMYTMTPDEHFIVGSHPQHRNVTLVAGLSGHGFKFAPVLGELVADLVCDGSTALPCAFLAPERFAPARG